MKRKLILSIVLTSILCAPIKISASEELSVNESKEITVEKIFQKYDDDDKFLKLPDGGYLHGQAKIVDYYDNSIIYAEYDSETDPNSVSIEEAKVDLINSDNYYSNTRGVDIPNQTKQLAAGASYTSQKFSGSGWRFSSFFIQAAPGTNGNLEWTTYNDSALVGDMGHALNTLNSGYGEGHSTLYPGVPVVIGTKMNGWYVSLVYYTHNPAANTYYHVVNLR